MAFDEYEGLISDYITTIYIKTLQNYSLADIQTLFSERGYGVIDSMDEALDVLYDCFNHEICDQASEFMSEFGPIAIKLLLYKDQHTEMLKSEYEQLKPDLHAAEKMKILVESLITIQKNELLDLMKKDMLVNNLPPSTDELIQKYLKHSFDWLTPQFSLQELLHLLKQEDIPLNKVIMIDSCTVLPLIKNTLFF
ncbi:hypothetical protein [Niallia sp. 03190]|uniref:hypothetical protein n=1 Tax=Niallia sp. 03190 TaxID=3458061 RepID=UPI004044519B